MSERTIKGPGIVTAVAARCGGFPGGVCLYPLCMAALVIAVYGNTFQVPFLFDDHINIVENPSIRHLQPISQVLSPPSGIGIAGRPLVNLSLALNYAVSGYEVWSYHLVNMLIHLAAALCLFGIVRRTLQEWNHGKASGGGEAATAFACASLWALHPLQTQAVTYTIQRCESLMGLFFFLTFYLALRGWQAESSRRWHLAAILAFLLGAATKEVIAMAPALLLIYERIFIHRSWRRIGRASALLYAGLTGGLAALGCLVAAGGTASSGTDKLTFAAFDYWRTQPEVILHYLRLFVWPDGLTLDYGWPVAAAWNWPATAFITAAGGIAFFLLIAGQPLGFLLTFFFALLAPTSLVPLPDAAFDHRMYLSSAALVVIAVAAVQALWRRISARRLKNGTEGGRLFGRVPVYLFILLLSILGVLTAARNLAYSSEVSIWGEAVRTRPENSRARTNLGRALMQAGQTEKALVQLEEALRIETENAGRSRYVSPEDYLRIRSVYVNTQEKIAWILMMDRQNPQAAIGHLQSALKIEPFSSSVLTNMAMALSLQGKPEEAEDYYNRALRIKPDDAALRNNYAFFLRLQGRNAEARVQYEQALRLDPVQPEAHFGLGMVLLAEKRTAEAKFHMGEALRLNPQYRPARQIMEQLGKPL